MTTKLKRYSIWNARTGRVIGNALVHTARNEEAAFNKVARDLGFRNGQHFANRALGMSLDDAMAMFTFEITEH